MADSENSVQQVPTIAITSKPKKVVTLSYDSRYVRKKGGVAKVAQLLLSFLGFVSIQCAYVSLNAMGKWYSTVSTLAVWVTGILMFCYLFNFVQKFVNIPWIKFEFVYCLVMAFCFLVASVMATAIEFAAFQAAAFFGFCAAIVYALDAYSKYLSLKSGDQEHSKKEVDKEADGTTA